MKFCPSCRRGWPAEREVCPRCLTPLVEDLAATVRCRICGKEWPAWMQSCPDCLAVLRVDPAEAAGALQDLVAAGARPWRPDGRPPFCDGPTCTLRRLSARGSLVFLGPDDFIEAEVDGPGGDAVPPLTCRDVDGAVVFSLLRYDPAEDALVAFDGDRAPLATFLRTELGLDVRDDTSAPVAALRRAAGGYDLIETGGAVVATLGTADVEDGEWIDDQWWLDVGAGAVPLKPLGAVALVLAAKVLFGRASPAKIAPPGRDDDWQPFS